MLKSIIYGFNDILIVVELLVGIYLIIKSRFREMPFLFIGLFILILSSTYISLVFYYKRFYFDYPHLAQIENFLVLSHAPIFYLFICSLLDGNDAIKKQSLLHFIPAVVGTLITIPFYISPVEAKIEYLNGIYSDHHPLRYLILSSVTFLQYAIYYVICFRRLIRFSYKLYKIKTDFSETKLWVDSLTAVFYISMCLSFYPGFIGFSEESASYIPIVSSPYFFFIVYSIIRTPYHFKMVSMATEVIDSVDYLEKNKKVENMAEKYTELANRMHKEIVTRKLFKDSELSLNRLSTMLETKSYMITWVLKNHYNETFYNYINSLRVAEAKRLLSDKAFRNYTIDYIGQQVGFNSKSVFYSAFKKDTGETPMQHQKKFENKEPESTH